ncbi:MAG TPA: TolC family protein [Candidatus Omnitrophota bacterium]|nr:TolC family protein [Candidatus Omnitrophota bacterium]HPB68588.1 TolC family protein [Candidatus Omnitrophota bacterium]HQO57447.1 TolC family protein [Candidatus Omnitrophota bacterium]
MKRQTCFILNFGMGMLLSFNNMAFAGDLPTETSLHIGLEETIQRALAASEELKIKDREIDKKQGDYREERSGLLPHVSAQSTWTRNMSYPEIAASEVADYQVSRGISASQVIWSFGKVMYAVDSAKRNVEASRFKRDASRREIIYTAKLSYYSALLAKNTLSITEKSYANVVENKNLLEQRSYGGRSSTYEILRMNADVAARVPTVNESKTQFDAAMETLKKLIDVDQALEVSLQGDFKENYDKYVYDALVAEMFEREPYLKSLDRAVESADAEVRSRKSAFLPTVSAFSSWSQTGASNESSFPDHADMGDYLWAGVKLDIPIWEGGANEAKLIQSQADRDIAVLRKKQAQRNYLLDLRKACLEYEQYKNNLAANTEAVELAQELFKQAQEMFSSGQVALTDLNDAELLLTNQRLNKEMTLYNINVTLAKIEKLVAGQNEETIGDEKF